MGKKLKNAETEKLVIQTGRNIERLARTLVPVGEGEADSSLSLRERMLRLKGNLEPDTWEAYIRWSKARNAYVHGEVDALPNRDQFYEDYSEIIEELEGLTEAVQEDESESLVPIVLVVVIILVLVLYFL